jgi:hypothetical protein
MGIDKALRKGSRSLPGGSSLFRLLKDSGKFSGACTPYRRQKATASEATATPSMP